MDMLVIWRVSFNTLSLSESGINGLSKLAITWPGSRNGSAIS
jgi:hypothetical protein